MDKLSYKTLFLILVLLLIPIVLLLRIRQKPIATLAAWWNDSWMYRTAINISTHNVGETNVYIVASVNIGATSKAQADDGDFRFTDQSGNLLPYYIASGVGTTSITFHINFASFPAGAQTIFAYYGNPSADNGFNPSDFATEASNYSLGANAAEETGGGPIAWWKFDEGVGTSTYNSSSTDNINGRLLTQATWATEENCVSGKCIAIDDVGTSVFSTVTVRDNAVFGNIPALTVEVWIRTTSSKSTQQIIYKRNNGASPYWWSYRVDLLSLKPTFQVVNAGATNVQIQASSAIQINKWYHITGVYNGSQMFLYVNGVQAANPVNQSGAVLDTDSVTTIGGLDTANAFYVKGFIDDTKIFNYARTAAQVKQDYSSDLSGQSSSQGNAANIGSASLKNLTDGLVGWWKFDEGTGSSAADLSGNLNTASFGNGDSSPSWSGGKYANALLQNGVNSYAITPNSTSLNITGANISYGGWVYLSDTTPTAYSVVMQKNGWTAGYRMMIKSSTRQVYIGIGESQGGAVTSAGAVNLNSWNHLFATFDGQRFSVYINGVLDKSVGYTGSVLTYNSGITFGKTEYPPINGKIDELRVYNRTLSPAEIRQLYSFAPGPLVWYKFEEGTGTTAYDSSGNGNNASIVNSPQWVTGKNGKALQFSGNTYTSTGTLTGKLDKTLTAEAWVDYTGIDTNGLDRVVNRGWVGNGWLLGIYDSSDVEKTYCSIGQSGVQYGVTATNITPGKYHLALTYDGTVLKCYVNGVFTGSNANMPNASFDSSSNIIVGQIITNPLKIDEVKIYDYARTQSQILEDMGTGAGDKQPLAWYRFDEGQGTVANNSGSVGTTINASLGSGGSAPVWTNGIDNKALQFDGVDDVVTANDPGTNSPLDFTNEVSISMWLKPTRLNGVSETVFLKGWNILRVILEEGASRGVRSVFNIGGTDIYSTTPTNLLTQDQWHHLVVSYDGSNIKTYLNAKLVQQTPASGTMLVNNAAVIIGNYPNNTQPFQGNIDEVKLYNYALTLDEVKTDYNGGSSLRMGQSSQTIGATTTSLDYCLPGDTAFCAPPSGYWKFEENTGTSAFDTSGNGNNAGLTGAYARVPGKYGSGFNFTTGNYFSAADNSTLRASNAVTIEAWIKRSADRLNNWNTILDKRTSTWEYWFGFSDTNRLDFMYNPNDSSDADRIYFNSAATVLTDTASWHHVAATYDKTTVRLFIDGIEKYNVGSTEPIYNSNGSVNLGSSVGGAYNFTGNADEVKIYTYARTPGQIAWDYNQGGPVGYWRFDECQGSIANDSSGLGNTGTINIGVSGTQNSLGTCTVGTSAAWTNGAAGKRNGSLSFDGNDDYIDFPNFSCPKDKTISMWVKPSALSGDYITLMEFGNDSPYLGIINRSGYKFELYNQNPRGTTTPATGQWYHVVYTSDSAANVSRLYINGVLEGTGTSNVQTTTGMGVGFHSGDTHFSGQIDDVQVFSYALTASQIKTLYTNGAVNFGN